MSDIKISTTDDVVLVRWNRMTLAALDEADRAVKQVHERAGKPIIFIAVLAADCPLPEEAVRDRQRANLPWMQSVCGSICLVFEGSGLKVATLRSVAASLFLVLGNRRMHMCNTFDDAVKKSAPERPWAISEAAVSAGIIAAKAS